MVIELDRLATNCIDKMKEIEPMKLSSLELSQYYNASHCHICSRRFERDDDPRGFKVRDHCHLTGKYRGVAHNKCNFYFFCNRFLPVVMHNLKGYDSHLIIKEAFNINKTLGDRTIDAIPNSYEKFMSITIGDLRFIDSCQFMASSLEKLVEKFIR